MTTGKLIALNQWPAYLEHELQGRVELSFSDERTFCVSKDARGSVVELLDVLPPEKQPRHAQTKPASSNAPKAPEGTASDPNPSARLEKASKESREDRQGWTKALVRAGYVRPGIDPEMYGHLIELRRNKVRVEVVVDTAELNSGTVHWLVRFLGPHLDLVYTPITHREIVGWGDRDAKFLASMRALERLPHRQPLWRRLDVEDEAALLLAKGSKPQPGHSGKSEDADILLLRAASRYILDAQRGLRRFFMTADKKGARTAAQILPAGSVITTWVNPLPSGTRYLSPLHWWPSLNGRATQSHLAHLIWEVLAETSHIVVSANSCRFKVCAYQEGQNEFASYWTNPIVWVHAIRTSPAVQVPAESAPQRGAGHGESTTPPESKAKVESSSVEPVRAPSRATLPVAASAPGLDSNWPLSLRYPSEADLVEDASRIIVGDLVRALNDARTEPSLSSPLATSETSRALRRIGLVDPDGGISKQFRELANTGSRDAIANALLRLRPLHIFVSQLLKRGRVGVERGARIGSLQGKLLESTARLARFLGLAVRDANSLSAGGREIKQDEFVTWLRSEILNIAKHDHLNEAPSSKLSRCALAVQLSPARLQDGLAAVLAVDARLQARRGGSAVPVLQESVLMFNKGKFASVDVSGDFLAGAKSWSWKE
ncbi:MAG: hypothetical protein HOW73_32185 [Polyangiaceae bacterium]|nr:hypothetical protein [Polyangiaceae bacterium]